MRTKFGTIHSTFYNTDVQTLTIQDIKRNGAKALPDDRPVMLIVNSKPKAIIIPAAEYEDMVDKLEDLEDLRIAEERMKDGEFIPAEDVYKALGI